MSETAVRKPAPAPLAVQRKCACGGGAAGTCAACAAREEELAIQRDSRERDHDPMNAEAPVLRARLGPGLPLAPGVRARMESRLGGDFSRVRVHEGLAAAALASQLSANAFTIGNDIAFASGRYRPGVPAGDHLIAHELAHVVQQASGRVPASPAEYQSAEAQADRSAESAVPGAGESKREGGGRSALRDGSANMPRRAAGVAPAHLHTPSAVHRLPRADRALPAAPAALAVQRQPQVPQTEQEIVDGLETVASTDADEATREGAVARLLRMFRTSRSAREALQRLVTHEDGLVLTTAVRTVAERAGEDTALWDLVFASATRDAWGARNALFLWVARGGGGRVVDFLRRKLGSSDLTAQRSASRIIVLFLFAENEPESRRLASFYNRLREAARRGGLYTGGILGVESLASRIDALFQTLSDLANELTGLVRATPTSDDPHHNGDLADIAGLRTRLNERAAEFLNRADLPESQLPQLEQTTAQLTELLEALTLTVTRTRTLHENAALLRRFFGAGVESDEITALYEVRSAHIAALLAHPQARRPQPGGTAATTTQPGFRVLWLEALLSFDQYDQTVAAVKWKRIRPRITEANNLFNEGFSIRPGGGAVDDPFYFEMKDDFERRRRRFDERYFQTIRGQIGGRQVVVRGVAPAPVSLQEASRLELQVALHGFDAALFGLYALALRLNDVLVEHDIGSAAFRARLIRELTSIRSRLRTFWRQEKFKEFADNATAIQQQLRRIAQDIQDQVHQDLWDSLLITLIAAVVSAGVGALVRIALAGEVIAGVRSAQAAATVVYLAEAGAFTATQLTGESLTRGTPPSLGRVAMAAVENLAFFGAFRAVGRLTAGFAQANRVVAFVAVHGAGLATVTGVSAVLTRIETGSWPQDVGLFLLNSAASYAIVATVHGVMRAAYTNPRMTELMRNSVEELGRQNEALLAQVRTRLGAGTLSEPDFEAIQRRKIDIYSRLIEIVRFARSEGIQNADDATALERFFTERLASDSALTFATLMNVAAATGRIPGARALPAPHDVAGLVRVGDTNVYRYQPSTPPSRLRTLLEAYRDAGYEVNSQGAGVVRVTDAARNTVLVLAPATSAAPIPLLPAATGGAARGFVERATGVTAAEIPAVETALASIHRDALATLQNEFPEATSLAAVALLYQNRGVLNTRWNIDAIRGLATMLELERGILVSNVRRLFLAFNSTELNALFQAYLRISQAPRTQPGVNLLLDAEITPQRSRRLIEAYNAIRRSRVALPSGMDIQAVRGLLRLINEHPADWIDRLGRVRSVDDRLAFLQRLSPVVSPQAAVVPGPLQDAVRRLSGDVAPGINPLHGTPEQVTQEVERQAAAQGGGRFHDLGVRTRFVDAVRQFQQDMDGLRNGNDGLQENAMGGRGELVAAVDALLTSGEIIQFGRVGRNLQVTINPGLFDLGRGIRVINAPSEVNLQIDVVVRRITGTGELLQVIEVTDADLSLPTAWQVLDPNSGLAPANIDWNALSPRTSTSHRKWHQVIARYAAVEFARQLGTHWGSGQVLAPQKIIRARSFSAAAERALRALGFDPQVISAAPAPARVQPCPAGAGAASMHADASELHAQLGAGVPLGARLRSRMEARLGADIGEVRIHDDATAAGLSRNLSARAFTVGSHVAFASGSYRPGSANGDQLIAHELAHVVQQSQFKGSMPLSATAYDQAEREACAAANSVAAGGVAPSLSAAPVAPALQPETATETDVPEPRTGVRSGEQEGATGEEANEPAPRIEVDELDYAFFFVGGEYGRAARAFIRTYLPEHRMVEATSFEAMFDRLYADLQRVPRTRRAHIRELVIVTHANAAGGLRIPLTRGDVQRHRFFNVWDLASLQQEFRDGLYDRFRRRRHEVVTAMFDEDTRVVVRGCEFGQSDQALDALRSFFGGQPFVWAPKAFQGFETLPIGRSFLQTPEQAFDFLLEQNFLPPELQPLPDEGKREYIARVFGLHGAVPADFLVAGPDAYRALRAQIAAHRGTQASAEEYKSREASSIPSSGEFWGLSAPGPLGYDPELDRLSIDEIEARARALNNPYRPQNAAMLRRLMRAWERKGLAVLDRCNPDDPLCGLPPSDIFGVSNITAMDEARFPGPRLTRDQFEEERLTPPPLTQEERHEVAEYVEPPAAAEGRVRPEAPATPPAGPGERTTASESAAEAYRRALDFSKSLEPPEPSRSLREMTEAELGVEYQRALGQQDQVRLAAVEAEIERRIDDSEHPGFGVALPRDLPPGSPANAFVEPDIALKILENVSRGEPPFRPELGTVGRVSWFITEGNPYVGGGGTSSRVSVEVELTRTEGLLVFRETELLEIFERMKVDYAARIEAEFRGRLGISPGTALTRKMRKNLERLLERAAERRMWENIGEQVRASSSGVGEVILENSRFSRGSNGRFGVVSDARKVRLRGGVARLLETLEARGVHPDPTATSVAIEVATRERWTGRVRGAFRYGGRILIVVGLANDAYRIITARDTVRTVISVAGGWAGATAAGALFAEVWTPADAAGPWAWLAHGVGTLVAGGIGYFVGSETTTYVYDLAIDSDTGEQGATP